MVEGVHPRRTIGAFNMNTQVECAFVDEVTPSLTEMRELAPQILEIPKILIIQSITVEYAEEYIIVKPMDSRVLYTVSSLGCWRRQSY
jgi:hypothetical protein